MKENPECLNYNQPRGCELAFSHGLCTHVDVERVWLKNGELLYTFCRCKLIGLQLCAGFNFDKDKLPESRKQKPLLEFFRL